MKKLLLLLMSAVLLLGTAGLFAGCGQAAVSSERYVSLSINPLVEFVVGQDDKVQAVNYCNEDAETLLAETDLVGLTLEEAAEKFLALATEAGYIDVDSQDNEIKISVIGESEEEKTVKSLTDRLNKYFENNGIYGCVSKDTLAEYAEQAEQLGVSAGKMKMVLRALYVTDEYTLEELAKMPVNELVSLFKTKVKVNPVPALREEFNAEKDAIKENYAQIFTLEKEIEALQTLIANFSGAAEDKAVLEAQLAEKQERYDTLKAQYDEEIEALNEKYKEQFEALRESKKSALQERKNANKEKIKKHIERFEKNKEDIIEKIRKWR